jgi:hypothetical protein
MVRIITSTFFCVPETDRTGFGGDKEDFGAFAEMMGAEEGVDDKGGRDG